MTKEENEEIGIPNPGIYLFLTTAHKIIQEYQHSHPHLSNTKVLVPQKKGPPVTKEISKVLLTQYRTLFSGIKVNAEEGLPEEMRITIIEEAEKIARELCNQLVVPLDKKRFATREWNSHRDSVREPDPVTVRISDRRR